jgi:ABC-type phosphate transport system auxiliary subunit
LSEKEEEIHTMDTNGDGSFSDVLTELSSLKERDKSMQTELKELQERYSEMSLKFAEVEGERQKLFYNFFFLINYYNKYFICFIVETFWTVIG